VPPSVIAHRGASGHAYQNSPSAFAKCLALGADGVELDIHATADGTLLVHHDAAVAGVGLIADHPAVAFADARLPNGEPIPTLPQVLTAVRGLDVWVEVKTLPSTWDTELLRTLENGPTPTRYAVHAFDHRIIARLGERRPSLRRGILLASYLVDVGAALGAAGADTLWMETERIDDALVQALHEDGYAVIAWTANTEAEIRRLRGLGVDGICGNYPDQIRTLLS
jgi:glycerophosphoryl diester phosphodiesterase